MMASMLPGMPWKCGSGWRTNRLKYGSVCPAEALNRSTGTSVCPLVQR